MVAPVTSWGAFAEHQQREISSLPQEEARGVERGRRTLKVTAFGNSLGADSLRQELVYHSRQNFYAIRKKKTKQSRLSSKVIVLGDPLLPKEEQSLFLLHLSWDS